MLIIQGLHVKLVWCVFALVDLFSRKSVKVKMGIAWRTWLLLVTFFVWFKMALLISNYIKDQAGSRLENHLVVTSFNPLGKKDKKSKSKYSISFHITPKHRGTVSDCFPGWSLPSSCQVSNASAARQEVPWSFALPLLMVPRRRVVWAPCWKGSELRWEVAPSFWEKMKIC